MTWRRRSAARIATTAASGWEAPCCPSGWMAVFLCRKTAILPQTLLRSPSLASRASHTPGRRRNSST
eukprot:2681713-Heterocapsa_arctica.AAC.1